MFPIIFILSIIFYIAFKITNTTENFAEDIPLLTIKSKYNNRINEMNNLDMVLQREIINGESDINNTKPYHYTIPNIYSKNIKSHYHENKYEILKQIKKNCILKNKEIIEHDNYFFYYDHRYPKQLLPVDFALDPLLYIKNNPTLYPSYIFLKDNNKEMIL
jgi:hypothetical protein